MMVLIDVGANIDSNADSLTGDYTLTEDDTDTDFDTKHWYIFW